MIGFFVWSKNIVSFSIYLDIVFLVNTFEIYDVIMDIIVHSKLYFRLFLYIPK